MMVRTLFDNELAAIKRFAAAHGRFWKRELLEIYWYNARPWHGPESEPDDGAVLHGLRNDPNWGYIGLRDFKLNKA